MPVVIEFQGHPDHELKNRILWPLYNTGDCILLAKMSSKTSQKISKLEHSIPSAEELKKKLEISNFHPDAILRGAQLTVVGGMPTNTWKSVGM